MQNEIEHNCTVCSVLYISNVTVMSCHVYVGVKTVSAMEIKTEPDDLTEYLLAHYGISAELQPAAHHLS